MKFFLKKIVLLNIAAISLLVTAGCSDSGQSRETGNIVSTGTAATEIRPVCESKPADNGETEVELIDLIRSSDSLNSLFDIYGEYSDKMDGAYAEAYGNNLLRLYKEAGAPEFIKILAERGWSHIYANSEILAGEAFVQGDIQAVNEMKTECEDLRDKTALSSDELNAVNEILAAVEKIRLANTSVYIADGSDFTLWKGSNSISLYDQEDDEKLSDMLGKPGSETVEQLGPDADTYNGSFVKELSYDGIKLLLFAAEAGEKAYWIYDIAVTGEAFLTAKGIGVGSSLSELKEQYPFISMAKDGREDENNCAYEINRDYGCSYLTFEIKDGKVDGIDMFVSFP